MAPEEYVINGVQCNFLHSLHFSSSGDHKQKFYWGHKEILIPGMLSLFYNLALIYIQFYVKYSKGSFILFSVCVLGTCLCDYNNFA